MTLHDHLPSEEKRRLRKTTLPTMYLSKKKKKTFLSFASSAWLPIYSASKSHGVATYHQGDPAGLLFSASNPISSMYVSAYERARVQASPTSACARFNAMTSGAHCEKDGGGRTLIASSSSEMGYLERQKFQYRIPFWHFFEFCASC